MTAKPVNTLAYLAAELSALRTSSRALVAECLERITSHDGEGTRVFLKVYGEQAVATAEFYDRMRKQGARLAPYAGIPVSSKDLFDVAGDTTTAGSTILKGSPPAIHDAPVIARLRSAGFIVMGRTNMTEFAFSGLGLNPHYGTPLNPWDRRTGRIPGGSSSGAAVSVTDAMSYAAVGTDTGGSCRIPAAMCGIVGFKPTARRIPLTGTYPLATSLDSIGPLANSVACCAALDAVMSGESSMSDDSPGMLEARGVRGVAWVPGGNASACGGNGMNAADLRLGVLTSYVTEELDPIVARNYDRAIATLGRAGTRLTDLVVPELAELTQINRMGGIPTAEAFAHHRALLAEHGSEYDPRVANRILRGRDQSAADFIDLLRQRADFIKRVSARLHRFDAVLMPTIPICAPALTDLVADEAYLRMNGLALRNTSIVNFLDGCAISIPCHEPESAPVGLSLVGLGGTDSHVLSAAAVVEGCLHCAP